MNTIVLKSASQWKLEGRIVKRGAIPDKEIYWSRIKGYFNAYSFEKTVPKKERQIIPEKIIDTLAAIHLINQTAKRFRDAKESLYEHKKHGLLHHFKNQQTELYALKDKGLKWAFENNLVEYSGRHEGLALYVSIDKKYSFHSFFTPEIEDHIQEPVTLVVPAKEKKKDGLKLKDAIFTIKSLPEPTREFFPITSSSSLQLYSRPYNSWIQDNQDDDEDDEDDDYDYDDDEEDWDCC